MAAEHVERIGARIRQRRDELGLSRGEVARQMPGKTNENAIYRWEKGLHAANPDTLEALATVLDVDTSYFYVDQPEGETPNLAATFNGRMPDELRDQLDRIEARLGAIEKDQAKLLRNLSKVTPDHDLIEETHRAVAELLGQPGESDPPADEGERRREAG
jgi:transcriptional regulator with XRE-family HTH domain